MSMRSRSRARRREMKANIDMNSLIDLTFLLLVVFIVTLPTLEQTVPILLPTDKVVEKKEDVKLELVTVTVDQYGKVYIGDAPTTLEDFKSFVQKKVVENSEGLHLTIRGDVRASYGDVYEVFKIAKDCNAKHLGLAVKER